MSLMQALSNKDVRTDILSYLTLAEISTTIRLASASCCREANEYKKDLVKWLQENPKVLIIDLQSDHGKTLNGRIAQVDGPLRNGRYPVRLDVNWLSGESEVETIKLCNLHQLFHQPNFDSSLYSCPPLLQDYSQNAKIRESHGRVLYRLLGFARWNVKEIESIEVEGTRFSGDINDFLDLPLAHPFVQKANQKLFNHWSKAPFCCSRTRHRSPSTLNFVVEIELHNSPDVVESSIRFASYSAIWPADGYLGKNLMANFFQCMRSWEEESVTGGFWVTDEYQTGTVMVHLTDLNDPKSLGTVYVVKGHKSSIGELMKRSQGRLPAFCRTTILPLYDLWTYDGLVVPGAHNDLAHSEPFQQQLRGHVSEAIASHNVSWRGPSAELGLWDFANHPPPAPHLLENEDGRPVLDWPGGTEMTAPSPSDVADVSFTDQEMEVAKQIVAKAIELGGTRKLGEDELFVPESELTAMIFCHLQPGVFKASDTRIEGADWRTPLFWYETGDDACSYTLKIILDAILATMTKSSPLPLVHAIYLDDRNVLPALDAILVKVFEEEGLIAPEVNNI